MNILKILICESIIILVLFFLPIILIKDRLAYSQEDSQLQISLSNIHQYSYNLPPTGDLLSSISLQLKNPLIKNNSKINLSLIDSKNNNLADYLIYGSNVGDPSWLEFKLPRLASSQGLRLSLSTDNTLPESLFILSDQNSNWDIKLYSQEPNFWERIKTATSRLKIAMNQSERGYVYLYIILLLGLNIVLIWK